MANEQENLVKSVRERHRLLKHALAFLILLLFLGESFLAGQYYIYSKGDWLARFGQRREGPYNTLPEAQAAQRAMARGGVSLSQVMANTEIKGAAAGGGSDSLSPSGRYSGNDPRLMVVQGLLDFIFAKPDTSARDALAKQKEEERKREEERIEAERKEKQDAQNAAALEDWRRQQEAEKAEREKQEKERWKQSEDLLGKIGTVGGDASVSSLTIKPLGTDFFGREARPARSCGHQGRANSPHQDLPPCSLCKRPRTSSSTLRRQPEA